MFPKKVTIVEVSARDGLQNEKQTVPTEIKLKYIDALSQTGLSVLKATSFVSPKWVPQMADHSEILAKLNLNSSVRYPVLVPNLQGFNEALKFGVKEIAVFTAASETFSQKNTNSSIAESLQRIAEVCSHAKKNNISVRGYVSTVLGCPFEGKVAPEKVAEIAAELINLGCYQISLGDTIGVGTALNARKLVELVTKKVALENLAVHFHDTYGQALANIYACLEVGITTIDSSVAGLGGCPYAPGAGGNVATEDVIYLLNGLNIETGVDLEKLIKASRIILDYLKIPTRSKTAQAILNKVFK